MTFTTNVMGRLRDLLSEELARLGLQQRPSLLERLLPAVGIFAGGVVVGLGIGLLIAPRSGAETRAGIGRSAARAGGRAKEIYQNVVHHTEDAAEATSDAVHAPAVHAPLEVGMVPGNGKARISDADKRAPKQPPRA